jgi:HK97 family phage portal protein
MPNWLDRIFRPLRRAVEGEPRPGPFFLPISGGWLPADAPTNWWQTGFDIQPFSYGAMVEACVSSYSQTTAMCPGVHWLTNSKGGRDRVSTSALSRILKIPNSYQTASDFFLNTTRSLYMDGNAYALALRNDRFEIAELHLMKPQSCAAVTVQDEDGEASIFYSLGGNQVIDQYINLRNAMVPARDVLHIKLHTPRNVLRGESPIWAVAQDIAANNAMLQQQLNFYLNQARPSMVLTTDMTLDKTQVEELRQRWNEQARGLNSGGVPILTAGIKPQMLNITSEQAQLAEVMKLSKENIALAFRVPLQILGIGGAPLGSTEALMTAWVNQGLGFCLNHIETAFDDMFGLKGYPDEYTELDTSALLRSAFKDRVDAFVRGVQGGIFEPNYARAEFGLPEVAFGDEPRVQQQVVPLSAAGNIPPAPGPGAPPAASPAAPVTVPAAKGIHQDVIKWVATDLSRDLVDRGKRIQRTLS